MCQELCEAIYLHVLCQMRKLRFRETEKLALVLHKGGASSPRPWRFSLFSVAKVHVFCHPHLPADSFWTHFD